MKILCDRAALLEAVSVVSSVVPSKTTKPILQNVLLRADSEGISLFATDLEMAAKVRLDSVKVSKEGTVLLPGKETSALLRELSDPTVTLESTDLRCRIESGGGSFVLLGEDPEQFPAEATVASGKRLEMPSGVFHRMIQETMFAAAREETRYAINGVLVDAGAGCVRLVATDGRRLAISYENLQTDSDIEFKAVVPLRALSTLARALTEGSKDPITIEVGDTTVEIQKALLEGALRRTAILCAAEMRMVKFEVGDNSLRMIAESSSRGRADVSIDAVVKGAGGSINFNPDYILEALRQCDLDEIRLDMSDDSMPAKFTLGESFTYVVMPISGA